MSHEWLCIARLSFLPLVYAPQILVYYICHTYIQKQMTQLLSQRYYFNEDEATIHKDYVCIKEVILHVLKRWLHV